MEKKSERWDLRVQPSLNNAVQELADKLKRSRNGLIECVLWKATHSPHLFFVCCPACGHPQFDVTEIPTSEGVDRIDCDNCGNHFYYDFGTEKIATGRITIDPAKRSGQPCIRGLRTTPNDILGYLSSGMSYKEILEDFPYLEREDIVAALDFISKARHGS